MLTGHLALLLETKPNSYHPGNGADKGLDRSLLRMYGIGHRCAPLVFFPASSDTKPDMVQATP